jgi:ATP-binding cassette subfamily B protein
MPESQPAKTHIETLSATAMIRRVLTAYALPRWRAYALAFLLMAIASGCAAGVAYFSGDVINKSYVERDVGAVARVSLLMLVVFVLRGFAAYGQAVTLARIGNSIVAENQRLLFTKLLHHDIGFFAARHSSELVARLSAGAVGPNQALTLLATSIGRELLTLIGLVIVMVVQDPVSFLFALVVIPPVLLLLRKLIRRIRTVAFNQWAGGARILETLQETLQGIRIVKSFTIEDRMRSRFNDNVAAVEYESNKMARVGQRTGPLMETLGGMAIAAAVLYGGYRVIEFGATPGEFISFMTAFLLAYEPAKRLARLNVDLNIALVNVRILFDIVDSPATEPPDLDRPVLNVTDGHIAFREVHFSYRPNVTTLHDLSFQAQPGKVTALVGPSGGGKSTIFNLLLRFYEADGGTITIDGQDITAVARHSLRRQIAYVGQDVFLFRASVRDNIAFGRPDATDAEIAAAAAAAQAHDFISALPQGYATEVGERGLQLSGGERQRVAIARALIKDAPIILLDEATASLDSESEQLVQQAISELCRGRTTLVIAHRLSTIMHADRILVLEAGRIVESGVHDELLRKNGRYALFYRMQPRPQTDQPVVAVAGG